MRGILVGDVAGRVLLLNMAETKLGVGRWELGREHRKCRGDPQDPGRMDGGES